MAEEEVESGSTEGMKSTDGVFIPKEPKLEARVGKIPKRKDSSLAEDEEIERLFRENAKTFFDRFASDREPYEDIWEVADYMEKGAQNRSIFSDEKTKGMDLDDDERCNVGSLLFHRQVKQKTAQGLAVERSKPVPFKYEPIVNTQVDASATESIGTAEQRNLLAQWTLRKDDFDSKSDTCWYLLNKYGHCWEQVFQHRVSRKKKIRTPQYADVGQNADGTPRKSVIGYKDENKTVLVENYPSVDVVPTWNVYADPSIGNVQDQLCVVVVSPTNIRKIWDGVQEGFYSEEQVKKINKADQWNGAFGGEHKQDQRDSEGIDDAGLPDQTGQFLKWTVYMYVPVKDGKWNEEQAIPERHVGTLVGNSLDDAHLVDLVHIDEVDPDGEIPINLLNANAKDPDTLYCTSDAQLLRSNYSVECTLKGLAIDNMGLRNGVPLLVEEGATQTNDFTIRKDRVWHVDDVNNAIRELDIKDNTQSTVQLLEFIRDESRTAIATDPNSMGQGLGGRASSQEAGQVFRSSSTPVLMGINSVIQQRHRWRGRKYQSYWENFGEPDQIVAITDEEATQRFIPVVSDGEFDVLVNIVDEFEEDLVARQRLQEGLQLLASSPTLIQSETHQTDLGELLKEWLNRNKFEGSKIIIPIEDGDSREKARNENILMLQDGILPPVGPSENKRVHLKEHKAERLKWRGMEEQMPELDLLDQHIAETELQVQQGQVQQAGTPPAPSGNETEGQVAGNDIASALGAQLGG